MSARILKETAEYTASPLSKIFQKSLESGQIPMDWKLANITPIFKKGSKFDVNNYRPISLTCIVCKIMESVIKDHIMDHLEKELLLIASQHGFLRKKSCLTNLLSYLEKVSKMLDDGENIDLIYLDYAKAFDKVSHTKLKTVLESHGITGKTLVWIKEWLSNRKQRVLLNNKSSSWQDVESGVPQGSVLGPVCFVIFINILDLVIKDPQTFLSKFADDTKIGRSIKNKSDSLNLQESLNCLSQWCTDWEMKFNESKCKVLHIGKNNERFDYSLNGLTLEKVEYEKDIGVTIQSDLKPTIQCLNAAKKANQIIGQMSRSFTYRDKHVWINLYKSYVRPHLEYCIQAWCPWTQKDKEILENVQKRVIRMTSGLSSSTYEEKLKEVGLTTLEERRERGDMIEVWKILHNKEDVDPATWFKLASEHSEQETRMSSDPWNVKIPTSKTEARKHFFSVRTPAKWNNLPREIKSAEMLISFI